MSARRFGFVLHLSLALVATGLLVSGAEAAQPVYLTLEIDGNAVEGESTVISMERENTIECSAFAWGVYTPRDAATGQLTGQRQHRPIKITKRIDKSTPLLVKALTLNEPVTLARFRFFRPDNQGGGQEEHFYTVELTNGFIASITQLSEDAILAGSDAPPMLEEVTFVFQDITWTYEIGGVTHSDSISGPQ